MLLHFIDSKSGGGGGGVAGFDAKGMNQAAHTTPHTVCSMKKRYSRKRLKVALINEAYGKFIAKFNVKCLKFR